MSRDMSWKQFDEATKRHGFKTEGFLGYYRLPEPFNNTAVSVYNAGTNRRAQLAYLLRQLERKQKEVRVSK